MSTSPIMSAALPDAPPTPAPAPRAVLKDGGVKFQFVGIWRYGALPSTMTRMTLRRARDEAQGWSPEAREAQRKESRAAQAQGRTVEVLLDPSEVDPHALGCVFAACVGVCWPNVPGKPTFREHRHDTTAYGEAFIDWVIAQEKGKTAKVLDDLPDVGRALFGVLNETLVGLFAGAAEASGFTEKKEATGSN